MFRRFLNAVSLVNRRCCCCSILGRYVKRGSRARPVTSWGRRERLKTTSRAIVADCRMCACSEGRLRSLIHTDLKLQSRMALWKCTNLTSERPWRVTIILYNVTTRISDSMCYENNTCTTKHHHLGYWCLLWLGNSETFSQQSPILLMRAQCPWHPDRPHCV